MIDTDTTPPPRTPYFKLAPEDVPMYPLRQLVSQWVVPFNNLVTLAATLGLNGVLAGLVDLVSPRLPLFPLLSTLTLAVVVVCLLLQSGVRPAWTAAASRSAAGRLLLAPLTGGSAFLLLLLSLSGLAWAQAHPGGRGALATQSATMQSLQDAVLGMRQDVAALRVGVDQVKAQLDGIAKTQADAQAAAASRQAAAAARPDALGTLSLSALPSTANPPGVLRLHLAAFMNAPGLSLKQARLLLQTQDAPDGAWARRDLSPQLAGATDQQTLQVAVGNRVRALRLCLAAAYPDAAHAQAVLAGYTLDAARGDQALQPAEAPRLVPADAGPCGP